MYDNLARRAILSALSSDWQSALEANLKILEEDPENTDALNRSARAYLELGNIKEARSLSEKVLLIDPLNPIATRCLAKCETVLENGVSINNNINLHGADSIFLEIPGKTKIVSLVNLCEGATLARLSAGYQVSMVPRMHKVAVTTFEDVYIGRLPDDLANRIIYLVKYGNEYNSFVKSVNETEVKIFIREVKRASEINHLPSFPIKRYI